jgi:hypothetical protein
MATTTNKEPAMLTKQQQDIARIAKAEGGSVHDMVDNVRICFERAAPAPSAIVEDFLDRVLRKYPDVTYATCPNFTFIF